MHIGSKDVTLTVAFIDDSVQSWS